MNGSIEVKVSAIALASVLVCMASVMTAFAQDGDHKLPNSKGSSSGSNSSSSSSDRSSMVLDRYLDMRRAQEEAARARRRQEYRDNVEDWKGQHFSPRATKDSIYSSDRD